MRTLRGIVAGWLADGSGRPLARNWFIEFRSGRIRRIRSADGEDFSAPGIVDWSRGMVIPGLMGADASVVDDGYAQADADGAFGQMPGPVRVEIRL